MQYLHAFYHNKNVSLNFVKEADKGELNGAGKLLDYTQGNAFKDRVYNVTIDADLEG